MKQAHLFLEQYKRLEQLLEARYAKRKRRCSNAVMEFYTHDKEGIRYSEELNLCREVRNLLSHNAAFRGESAVEPSAQLTSFLTQLVEKLEHPLTAIDVATKRQQLFTAHPHSNVWETAQAMEKRGFSHVPILEKERLLGVFSAKSFLSFFLAHPDQMPGKDSTMHDLQEALPPGRHEGEAYAFASPETTYEVLRDIFGVEGGPRSKRLVAIFVTKDGRENTPLLGMITPWDLLQDRRP